MTDRDAVYRQFDIARLAVLKARACWAEWASEECKDATGNWLPGANEQWGSLIAADFAASGAEAHLEAAIAHVTGQSPLALVQSAAEALEAARRKAAAIPDEPEDECEGAPDSEEGSRD